MKPILVALCLLLPLAGEPPSLSIGIKGGVPVTHLTRLPQDESRPYTVGPIIEVGFGKHWAVEFSPLYTREGGRSSAFVIGSVIPVPPPVGSTLPDPVVFPFTTARSRANSWEFPILGKFYFPKQGGGWRPFAGTGYSFQRSWSDNNAGTPIPLRQFIDSSTFSFVSQTWNLGIVFSVGAEWKVRRAAVAPEFRYVRWADRSAVRNQNQAEFLLGIRF